MKILLAGPDYEENLSIRYLSSSLLEAGHQTTLAPFNSLADLKTVLAAAESADLVGLSMCFQSRAEEFVQLARHIKAQNSQKLLIAGGHYASCAAEELLKNHQEIDIVVIHEGEGTLVEIADAMPRLEARIGEVRGIAFRDGSGVRFTESRTTRDDLDGLPFPDRRGRNHVLAGVPTSYLMGSRGCYSSCAYCCITTLHRMAPGKRFRQRDAQNIAEEMSQLYHQRGTRQFVFHDDNFLVPAESLNHARLSALEKALSQRGVKDIALVIKCRPADATGEILHRLQKMGLVRVFMGIEASTERGLATLERRQTTEESEQALEICADLGISAQFTLMVFNPDATIETLRSDVAFMRRFAGNPLNFCRAEIYAGTPLEKRMMEQGRARGDYRARVYRLADPAADRACGMALELLAPRCSAANSLMQNAIGLDHIAAVLQRFYPSARQRVLCTNIGHWLRLVNNDTINLLEETVELGCVGKSSDGISEVMRAIAKREATTRQALMVKGAELRMRAEALPFEMAPTVSGSGRRLARRAAAAVLAVGLPAGGTFQPAIGQQANSPAVAAERQDQSVGSITGTVTDVSGAVVANATVTITNLDTGVARTLKTDETGKFAASGLSAGRYSARAQAPGFKVIEKKDIVVKSGNRETADIKLEVSDFACCEYVAVPLKTDVEDLILKKKPFTYTVGDQKDHNTFRGIAKLVYGDPKRWVDLFAANRTTVPEPGFIPNGTAILIPKRKALPKLVSKVNPVYPQKALEQNITGDVVMDLTLNDDGTVQKVEVVAGNPVLAEAAASSVKQWRYRAVTRKDKPEDRKFAVAVSFEKGGKIN